MSQARCSQCHARGQHLASPTAQKRHPFGGIVTRGARRCPPARCVPEPDAESDLQTQGLLSRRVALLSQTAAASLLLPQASVAAGTAKQTNLPVEQLKNIIAHDFQSNQYYITGNLDPSVFTDDCVFVDPTTRVQGVEKYTKAVAALFDHDTSRADLISIQVASPNLITTRWRFAASLNIPGKPKLKPYTGSTEYKINSDGLVYEHKEEWDISALDAFVSILLPSFGAPPAPPVENPVDI